MTMKLSEILNRDKEVNPSLIFFREWPVDKRDMERCGINYFRANGYRTYVFDLSGIIYSLDAMSKVVLTNMVTGDFVFKINTLKEFENAVKKIPGKRLVIAFNINHPKINWCFSMIGKLGIPYYVCSAGAYILEDSKIEKESSIRNILRSLFRRIKRSVLTSFGNSIPLPEKIFASSNVMYKLCKDHYGPIEQRTVRSHVHDFDLYVDLKRKGISGQEHCVFLDARMDFHNAAYNVQKPLVTPQKYYATVNKFFDHIERKTGLKVVIAAHPRSHYTSENNPFGKRAFIKNASAELVARSALVLLHGCTSFNFVVLFGKPAIFIKTQEIIDRGIDPTVDAIAGFVGQKAVNIDSPYEVQSIDLSLSHCPKNLYERYRDEYISFGMPDERSMWKIVKDTIVKTEI